MSATHPSTHPYFKKKNSPSQPPLRLVLMSATMDAAKVARYFQACNLPPAIAVVSASSGIYIYNIYV